MVKDYFNKPEKWQDLIIVRMIFFVKEMFVISFTDTHTQKCRYICQVRKELSKVIGHHERFFQKFSRKVVLWLT